MKQLRTSFALALAISMMAVACGPSSTATPSGSGAISSEPFVMLSTQFNTVTESEAVRKQILAGFTIAPVDFLGSAAGPFVDRITAETKTSKGQVGVIGGSGLYAMDALPEVRHQVPEGSRLPALVQRLEAF